ncbi:MAG: hypothetical protein AAF950_18240 [Pseudomonadota bacterium]
MAEPRSFHWTSTHETADRGEISVLAIVETLIAMAISLGIAWYSETILHIVVGACVAPLLLLRTEESTELGLRLADAAILRFGDSLVLVFFVLPVAGCLIRVCATAIIAIRRPLHTMSSIIPNWKKVTLCLDLASSPEIVPGSTLGDSSFTDLEIFSLYEFLDVVESNFDPQYEPITLRNFFRFSVISILLFLYFPAFIVAIFYRFSLKSTAIFWSPLLWVISSAQSVTSSKFSLGEISHGALYRVMRWYSVIILIVFAWKLTIWFGPQMVLLNSAFKPLLEPFIEPARMPLWQLASAINALLAFGLYLLAEQQLGRMKQEGNPYTRSDGTIKWHIGTITVIRNTLALYTIACTIIIGWKVVAEVEWPALEFVLFPLG